MTLLVKGVKITGREEDSPLLDVFISGDRISAIGEFPNKKAAEVVEGKGAWLLPGLIDASTHADHSLDLWRHPAQEDFAAEGVTTLVGGQGGLSLAPLPHGELEPLEDWIGERHVNVNWHGFGEFAAHLARRALGVNVASFVGYATVRHAIRGERRRALTKNELRVVEHLLDRSLREGALGVSLDPNARHADDVSAQELKLIAKAVARHGAIMGMRLNEGRRMQSLHETLKLADECGAKLLVDDLAPDGSGDYEELLATLDALPRDREACFALSPFGERVVPLSHFLPAWAREWEGNTAQKNVRDEWFAPRLVKDFPPVRPEAFRILRAPAVHSVEGATLKDFMGMHGIRDKQKALLALMRVTGLRGVVRLAPDRHDLIGKALAHPRALTASYRTSPSRDDDVSFATALFAGQEGDEAAARETARTMTHRAAKFFGFPNRGEIREGGLADLAGWKNGEVQFTIVNGARAAEIGSIRRSGAGRVLLRRP